MSERPHNKPGKSSAAEIAERRKRIAERVARDQFVSVQDLVDEHEVTSVTIRADIEAITKEFKQFRRVRGGIMRVQQFLTETRFEERTGEDAALKKLIGRAASTEIRSNESIFLDVGTTTMEIAQAIAEDESLQNVTVFTNGLNIALALESSWPRIQTVVTGGTVRPLQHSLVEPMAGLLLREIRVGKAFLGCNGIDSRGAITTTNLPEADIKKKIVESADEVYLVADQSKFGRRTLAWICDLADLNHCIYAGELQKEYLKLLTENDVNLINANEA